MIAVIADPAEHAVVKEFFELFKTPWEFYQSGRHYDVLLYTGEEEFPENSSGLVIVYGSRKLAFDVYRGKRTQKQDKSVLKYKEFQIPIYGRSLTFAEAEGLLSHAFTGESASYLDRSHGKTVWRVGYDLFSEIRTLLVTGQPIEYAEIPTLELHINLLRDVILDNGVPLFEIPPVPDGHSFIACLTHDIDHPAIRLHKFDHTMFGFIYRALFGSFVDVLRGRLQWRSLFKNWAAAAALPFVYLGWARDFWATFDDYKSCEQGASSTFFVIPFAGRPGSTRGEAAPRFRASSYGAADIRNQLLRLMSSGREIGLHGIDAWLESSRGRVELEEIRRITGAQEIGVRMHWLYGDKESAMALDYAGASYDSTSGYNETVGYRAGTTQAFRPLGANHLLELPLHVMDTALFFPGHLGLSQAQARPRVALIVASAIQFGGCVVVNWHDRSLAPERLWGEFYGDLVKDFNQKGAWVTNASRAVSWFRKRRAATFGSIDSQSGIVRVNVTHQEDGLPGLRLRKHASQESKADFSLNEPAITHISNSCRVEATA